MATKILHIVNTLTPVLENESEQIMRLCGMWLPFGRLFRHFTQEEIFRYCDDLKVRFPFGSIDRFAISLLTMLYHEFSQYEKIIVWHKKDIHEQLFFLLICRIIDVPLYEISISESSVNDIAYAGSNERYITQDEHLLNRKKWDSLALSDSTLRIMGKHGIEEAPEDFFDTKILKFLFECGLSFLNFISKLKGRVIFNRSLGNSADIFIYSRIIEKVRAGEIDAYALSDGRWKKFDEDIFRGEIHYSKIKVALPRNYSLPSEKKTLCLFPDAAAYAAYQKIGYDCDLGYFPSRILPFGILLPRSFDKIEWENYGIEIQKMLYIEKNFLVKELMKFFNIDFASYSKVIVIHGSSVNEQLFFTMVNALIDVPVYEWDVSHCTNNGLVMDSGEIAPKFFENVILEDIAEVVSKKKKEECIKLWTQITDAACELRINKDNQIINVPIDYLDDEIINVCLSDGKNYFVQAVRYAILQPHGLSFGALVRFVTVRLYQLAVNGTIFPYYRESKKKILQISVEQLGSVNPRKVFMRRYSEPQLSRSLFE